MPLCDILDMDFGMDLLPTMAQTDYVVETYRLLYVVTTLVPQSAPLIRLFSSWDGSRMLRLLRSISFSTVVLENIREIRSTCNKTKSSVTQRLP